MGYGPVPPRKTEDSPPWWEDIVGTIAKKYNMSQQDVNFLTGKTADPPATKWGMPYRRELWSPGNSNEIIRAINHSKKHAKEFDLSKGDPYYIQLAHDFRNELPKGTELLINKITGERVYYHELSNRLLITDEKGTIKSFYSPKYRRKKFDGQLDEGTYYGKIR